MANLNIQLSKQQQQFLVAAVLVIGGGGFAYVKYFWMPVSETIAATVQEIETVERKIDKAKGQAGRLGKIKAALALLNEKAAAAEKRLPKEQDLPSIIELITDLTKRYNLKMTQFSPGSRAKRPHFIEVAYGISASTTFHDLGRFLAALALEERIFNVQGLTYGTPDAQGKMTVTFQLISYQYKG